MVEEQTKTEVSSFDDDHKNSFIDIEGVKGELHLKAPHVYTVLKAEGIRGTRIAGKGSKKWYSKEAVQRIAIKRGSGSGLPLAEAESLVKNTAGISLKAQLNEYKDIVSGKDEKIDMLNREIGELQAEKGDLRILRRKLSQARKAIREKDKELITYKTFDAARKIIKKNERVMIGAVVFIIVIFWLATAPFIARIMAPIVRALYQ